MTRFPVHTVTLFAATVLCGAQGTSAWAQASAPAVPPSAPAVPPSVVAAPPPPPPLPPVVGPPPAAAPAGEGVGTAALGVRIDCLHDFNRNKGASQDCFEVTGLRYDFRQVLSPAVHATLRLDPFGSVDASRADSPRRADLPLVRDTAFVVVDDYALVWSPRPNLDVAFESYSGAARIYSVSGLALANSFADTGWKQTALTVTYNLSTFNDMRVRFAAGNGEGENGRNLDPQQYFGFSLDAAVIKGLRANVGVSLDGNSAGSAQTDYLSKRYQESCGYAPPAVPSSQGYSTQRLAAGLALDGTLPGAEGLQLGVGWQRNVASDLDKATPSGPTLADLQTKCATLDLDSVFVEDESGHAVNTVQRTTIDVSARYRLLGTYFVAADYTTRRIDTGSVKLFATCAAFADGRCLAPDATAYNNLSQTAVTVGGGMELAPGLVLTLEYAKTDVDRKYAQVFFVDRDDKTSTKSELFNARVAFNWK